MLQYPVNLQDENIVYCDSLFICLPLLFFFFLWGIMRGQNSAEHSLGNIGPNIYILIKNLESQNEFGDNSNSILEIHKIRSRDE